MYVNEFKTKGNKFKLRIKLSHHIILKGVTKKKHCSLFDRNILGSRNFFGYIISIQISISFYRMISLFFPIYHKFPFMMVYATVKICTLQVVFIAINCWVGTCRQEQNIDVFPKLVAIHTQFNGVEYKGSFKAAKMVSF